MTTVGSVVSELQTFIEQHGNEFLAMIEYLEECQQHLPANEFFTKKEIMLARLKGQPLGTVDYQIKKLALSGAIVPAVRLHRETYGSSLQEAKFFVDTVRDPHRYK